MTVTRIVVMGVAGSGKSTIGRAVADELGLPFVDADDLHPDANIAKLSVGTPLTDADRAPWLESIGRALAGEKHLVVACSALKREYRDAIRRHASDVCFVQLDVDATELAERIRTRTNHFLRATLLASQLEIFEALQPDEQGFAVPNTGSTAHVVDEIVERVKRTPLIG